MASAAVARDITISSFGLYEKHNGIGWALVVLRSFLLYPVPWVIRISFSKAFTILCACFVSD